MRVRVDNIAVLHPVAGKKSLALRLFLRPGRARARIQISAEPPHRLRHVNKPQACSSTLHNVRLYGLSSTDLVRQAEQLVAKAP